MEFLVVVVLELVERFSREGCVSLTIKNVFARGGMADVEVERGDRVDPQRPQVYGKKRLRHRFRIFAG
jgi:hypothetical protein